MLQTSEASERIQVAFEIIDLDRHGEIGSADIRRALQLLVRCTGGGVKSNQRSEAEAFKGGGQRPRAAPLLRTLAEALWGERAHGCRNPGAGSRNYGDPQNKRAPAAMLEKQEMIRLMDPAPLTACAEHRRVSLRNSESRGW